jgi:crossover junction endonuclease EME1
MITFPQYQNLSNKITLCRTQLQSHDTAFCMDSGQVKTGDGAADTFVKMLQEILRITAPVAFGIVEEYPTVQALIKGFAQNGPLALEDCRKSANKDGAFTDRRVGPAISKRVYNVFMGRDPESWDV